LARGRLTSLLLASGAAACFASAARAEPIQSFWLTPTVLANGLGGIEKTEAGEKLKALRAKALPQQQVNLFVAEEPAWNALGAPAPTASDDEFSTRFSDGGSNPAPVAVKLRGGSFDLEPSVNAKVGRLADGAAFGTGDMPAQSVGFDASLVNGRFTF